MAALLLLLLPFSTLSFVFHCSPALQLSTSFLAAAFVYCITVTTVAVTTLLLPDGHARVQLFHAVAPTSIAWRRNEGRGCS